MQTWQVEGRQAHVPWHDVAALVESAASPQPARSWLGLLSAAAPVDHLCVVEYSAPARDGVAVPHLVEGASAPGVANVTAECFALYRQRHWRDDEATRMAQCAPRGDSLTALHCRASDIQETWRRDVYDPAGLAARLSFLYQAGAGATAVLNLYRCHSQGPFALGEIERLMQVAPLVQLAHGLLARRRERGDGGSAPGQLAHALRRLRLRVAELSTREAEVAARIACGMSLDGIAADLDVAPSTVATLRKRVYAKLAARGLPSGRAQLARLAE